nr:octopamine receptor beta-1R-like [Pocillopora verrucosa]
MVCLIENSLICIAVYRNARLRSSTNLYIISLAISDIINAVIVMPFTVGVLITGEWPFGEAVCDFHAFFTLFSVYVSPTTMGLTAFNRYVRIVKPQHYPRIFTDTRSKIYIAAVFGKTKHHNLNMASTAHAEGRENRLTVKEIKPTKSLAIVVFAFALCWIPFWIIVMIQRFASDVVPRNIQLLCPFLMFFSSTINPFIPAPSFVEFCSTKQSHHNFVRSFVVQKMLS